MEEGMEKLGAMRGPQGSWIPYEYKWFTANIKRKN